jgi:D-tagatose-1,6-bisphosphate aldolase subunit GatZ/KbaZ
MESIHPLKKMVQNYKDGISKGIYSICSANRYVIAAAMHRIQYLNVPILIEATANQVNQYGGYTGMKPADFRDFVFDIAKEEGFPKKSIILGGDHLGPLTWTKEKSETAMLKAEELIRQYVIAGFTKIHIDTSMPLADDDHGKPLSKYVVAQRTAVLAAAAENAYETIHKSTHISSLVYVIGSEVPIPGGTLEDDKLRVTRASEFQKTVAVFHAVFTEKNLEHVWENVIAIVVQPGVEFGDNYVHEYDRKAAVELSESIKNYPNLVFEGHSTDYQKAESLRQMVDDGIAILKVGPALTFALREGLLMLGCIENELFQNDKSIQCSNFTEVLENAMLQNPNKWLSYHHGTENQKRIARKYSYSDRCRYYLTVSEVNTSINMLINNLSKIAIPLTLISQYFPDQYWYVREGTVKNEPLSLLYGRISNTLEIYESATSI